MDIHSNHLARPGLTAHGASNEPQHARTTDNYVLTLNPVHQSQRTRDRRYGAVNQRAQRQRDSGIEPDNWSMCTQHAMFSQPAVKMATVRDSFVAILEEVPSLLRHSAARKF
jgi:hypothetical protein